MAPTPRTRRRRNPTRPTARAQRSTTTRPRRAIATRPRPRSRRRPTDRRRERRPPERPAHKARMSVNPRAHLTRPRTEEEDDGRLEKKEDTVLGGRHFRINTSRGAVHVWVPPDYDRETAGTVIY